jgi:F0F1-type ATP synthase assembly protein I
MVSGDTKAKKDQYRLMLDKHETSLVPKSEEEKEKEEVTAWRYVGIAGQMGFDVAIPIVIGLLAGVEIDKRFGTAPKATLWLFGAGLALSIMSLVRLIRDMLNEK